MTAVDDADVCEIVGMNRAGQPLAVVVYGAVHWQEKYHARLGNVRRFGSANGVRAQWHGFQRVPVLLQIPQQLGYEPPVAAGLSGLCAGVRLSDVGDHVVQQLVVN